MRKIMDTDFANEYMIRATNCAQDLLQKNILLETKLALAEKVSRRLQEQLDSIQKEESKNKKSSSKEDKF